MESGGATSSNFGPRWVVDDQRDALPENRLGTEVSARPMTGLGCCEKSRPPHGNSIPDQSSPQQIAIPAHNEKHYGEQDI